MPGNQISRDPIALPILRIDVVIDHFKRPFRPLPFPRLWNFQATPRMPGLQDGDPLLLWQARQLQLLLVVCLKVWAAGWPKIAKAKRPRPRPATARRQPRTVSLIRRRIIRTKIVRTGRHVTLAKSSFITGRKWDIKSISVWSQKTSFSFGWWLRIIRWMWF